LGLDLKLGIYGGNLPANDSDLLGEVFEAHVGNADRECTRRNIVDEELALDIGSSNRSDWVEFNARALQDASGIVRDASTD